VRVLVVDDQRLFADALAMYLAHEDGIDVIGTAASGQEAIDAALEQAADVVLMDLFMPRMDELEALLPADVPRAAGRPPLDAKADSAERPRAAGAAKRRSC
jgi:DNA-binding NarL/FixJ family response regulator